jgi:hypothetical protein
MKGKLDAIENIQSLEKSLDSTIASAISTQFGAKLDTLVNEINELKNQPMARKSVTNTVQPVERFAKSQEAEPSSGNTLDMTNRADRRKAVNFMLSEAQSCLQKGSADLELEKEIKNLELGVGIGAKGTIFLKSLGYMVKQAEVIEK